MFAFAFSAVHERSALVALCKNKGNAAHLFVPALRFFRHALVESDFICCRKRASDYFVGNRYGKKLATLQAFIFLVSALRETCRTCTRAGVNDLFLAAVGTKNWQRNVARWLGRFHEAPLVHFTMLKRLSTQPNNPVARSIRRSTSEIKHSPRFVLECRGRLGSSEATRKKSLCNLLETLARIIAGSVESGKERSGRLTMTYKGYLSGWKDNKSNPNLKNYTFTSNPNLAVS